MGFATMSAATPVPKVIYAYRIHMFVIFVGRTQTSFGVYFCGVLGQLPIDNQPDGSLVHGSIGSLVNVSV